MSDQTRPVRLGEELDVEAVGRFLISKLTISAAAPLTIEQFPGGHSNLTYLVKIDGRELVLRRPPFGNVVKTAHDMGREVRILSALSPVFDAAPAPLAYCEDESVIGAPFYVMERIAGVIPRKKFTAPPETILAMCESLVKKLAELHALDWQKIGLGDFGKPDGFVERQVTGWAKRYEGAKTDDLPDVIDVADWLAKNLPASGPPSILHNDFKFDNLVFDEREGSAGSQEFGPKHGAAKIIGVLDWEMAAIGDPLIDLGVALGYWIEPGDSDEAKMLAFGPTLLPGAMSRREVVSMYRDLTGRDTSNMLFYFVFSLFKTAVVAQQIYSRFHKGLTKDERFAMMIVAVRVLAKTAKGAIARGSI